MSRRNVFCCVSVCAFVFLLGSRPAWCRSLRVVATVTDLGAIAREVLGPSADITVLAKPTQDPHFVDARPSLVLDLNRADAICLMGLDYEVGWLPVLLQGARNPALQRGAAGYLDASTWIERLDVPRGPVDRSMGDIHPGGNPHFTLDPRNGVRIARGLAERFARIDPTQRELFARNAEAFAGRVQARLPEWRAVAIAHQGRPIVTYHGSFVYLTTWLGLEVAGTVEPRPGIPPNPAYIASLVERMRALHVRAVLQERWYPTTTSELVTRILGCHLVTVDGMTPIGTSYIDHIDQVVRALAAGLS